MNFIKIIKVTAKVLPLVGNFFRNKDSHDGGKGTFHWKKFGNDLIDLSTTLLIGYFL